MNKETPYNTPLKRAVAHLKGQQLIKTDTEIGKAMGYGKSTVSAYVSGSIEASPEFLKKFEETFQLKLDDFLQPPVRDMRIVKETKEEKTDNPLSPAHIELLLKYTKVLEDYNACLQEHEKQIAELRTTVDGLTKRVEALESIVPAYQEWLIEEFVALNPQRDVGTLEAALGKKLDAYRKKAGQKGIQTD